MAGRKNSQTWLLSGAKLAGYSRNTMHVAQFLRGLGSLTLLVLAACESKDAAKCADAQQTARQALTNKDINLATQWREYAYKQCSDAAQLSALDKEIVDKRAAIEQAARDEAKKKSEQQQLIALFKDWVTQSRTAPERSVANPTCEGGDDDKLKKSKERFCSGARAVTGIDSTSLQVRFWEKTPAETALFSVRLPLPATCADLGSHRIIKSWDLPATQGRTVKRHHCELTDGALNGLQALVTEANSADLRVFTVKYPEQDPALRFQLK
ncbi:MAG TPA: hypothetical protein VKP30_03655 [Polyangiaceae bacterium]|nr:hypothetical protein [Polyangiaceae bacterium]